MISQCWVLLAIALFHYHVFCTRFRRIPAHDRWHLQRKQVAACTVTFRGPGAGICRRQLRSAPGPSGAARRRLGTVCFSSRILLLAHFFYLVYLHIYLRCTAIATRRKGRFSEPRKFRMGSKISSKIALKSVLLFVHFCKRSTL